MRLCLARRWRRAQGHDAARTAILQLGRRWCSRRLERRFYAHEERRVNLSFLTSDCGGKCDDWVKKCSGCWHEAGIRRGSQRWLMLSQGLQSGFSHPGLCYTQLANGASAYLREGGQGFWMTTNWPNRAYLLGRTGGYAVRGRAENVVAVSNVTHETSRAGGGGIRPWEAFDLGLLDQQLWQAEDKPEFALASAMGSIPL